MIKRTNLSMVKGDTGNITVILEGFEGTFESAYMTVKANPADSAPIVFQKTLGNGITVQDEDELLVKVAPNDTKNLTAGVYYYDIQVGANGDIQTVALGNLDIVQDITNV